MSQKNEINCLLSDNVSCACPSVMDALVSANSGIATSYGDDSWSQDLEVKFSEIFETAVKVFPVVTGTAANALALSALTPVYGKVFCHELAHINTDECAAPEFFTGGAKLIPIRGDNARLTAHALESSIYGTGNVHHAQPSVVSITQACESGTVYQLDDIQSITSVAHDHGLSVHMDGARFTNALVSLDTTPAEMTWKSGVDVLTFGGTKNGCFMAEAVIFFKPELAHTFPFLQKRAGQMLSKMRFVSAQFDGYLADDTWLRNARHANRMATRLSTGLERIEGIELAYPTQSNEVFVRIADSVLGRLKEAGIELNDEELDGSAIRFVAAWNTSENEIDHLLDVITTHSR